VWQEPSVIDSLLLKLLTGDYGPLPANLTVTIFGRSTPDNTRWPRLSEAVERIPLCHFTPEETQEYLTGKGITDEGRVSDIYDLSDGLPLLVATLAGADLTVHAGVGTVGEHIAAGDELIDALEALPGQRLNFPLLGVFPGDAAVLLLGAQVTAPLLDAHANVHAAIDGKSGNGGESDEPREVEMLGALYKPGSWVPHCTLAMHLDTESLARALRELHPYFGLRASIEKVGLVDMETGDVQDLVGNS
jgi:hypothetical protein